MLINPLFTEDLNLPTLLHFGFYEILIWQKHWLGLGCLTALLFSDCLVEHKVMVQCSLETCFQFSMAEHRTALLIQHVLVVFRVCKWNNRNQNLGNAKWKLVQCKPLFFSVVCNILDLWKSKRVVFVLARKSWNWFFLVKLFFLVSCYPESKGQSVCLKTDEKSHCVFIRKWSWLNKIQQISNMWGRERKLLRLILIPGTCESEKH